MNRRGFLASLPFLPAAAKAAVASPFPPLFPLDESPVLYPGAIDLDWIFEQIYAVKHRREADETWQTDFGQVEIWRDPYFHEAHR